MSGRAGARGWGLLLLAGAVALSSTALGQSAPTYYKGKGPGGNNSYAYRNEEDFSFLRDPDKSTDFFDPLKFIAFDDAKQIYLTFSGLERLRYDNNQNQTFNLGPQAKGHQTEAYERRTQLGADLHLGPSFRIYGELINAAASGRNLTGGRRLVAQWRNDLAWNQAFIEATAGVDLFGIQGKAGIRAGRQHLHLGNGVSFGLPGTPNVLAVPDGIRAYLDTGHDRLDLFLGVPTIRRNTALLADTDNQRVNYDLAYGSHDFPNLTLMGSEARLSDDPYLFYTRAGAGPDGAGRRTITTTYGNGAGTVGTITGQEEVFTIGDRIYGSIGNFDFDFMGALQRGSFGGYAVEAFGVFSDWGYTFRDLPGKPRLGTRANIASGGGDKASRTTHLYDNQTLRQGYIGQVVSPSPTLSNLYDLGPRLRVSPSATVSAEFSCEIYWRYSSADAVYGAPGPYATASVFAATLGAPGTYIGSAPQLDVRWTPAPHIVVNAEIGEMVAGPVIRNAGGASDTYGFVELNLKF